MKMYYHGNELQSRCITMNASLRTYECVMSHMLQFVNRLVRRIHYTAFTCPSKDTWVAFHRSVDRYEYSVKFVTSRSVCCSVLQCVAVCCSVLQCDWHGIFSRICRDRSWLCWVMTKEICVAVCCSVLQCVAVCCSILQCVAVFCSVLQCVAVWLAWHLPSNSSR